MDGINKEAANPLDPLFVKSMREIGTKSLLCISVSYLNERARAVILLHDKERARTFFPLPSLLSHTISLTFL